MPPIMGAAAFLMAEMVGVQYSEIAMRAIFPALLYFTGIFITVHLEAKRLGLKGIAKEDLPKIRSPVHPPGIPADPAGGAGGHGHDGLHHVPFSRDRHAVGDPGEHPRKKSTRMNPHAVCERSAKCGIRILFPWPWPAALPAYHRPCVLP